VLTAGWELEVPTFYCACAAVCRVYFGIESSPVSLAACIRAVSNSAWRFLVAAVVGAGSDMGTATFCCK
jgi:hypothetical protein